jgi:hypothetical protein
MGGILDRAHFITIFVPRATANFVRESGDVNYLHSTQHQLEKKAQPGGHAPVFSNYLSNNTFLAQFVIPI